MRARDRIALCGRNRRSRALASELRVLRGGARLKMVYWAYTRVIIALVGHFIGTVLALDNGLGRTPPMGFNVRICPRHFLAPVESLAALTRAGVCLERLLT